MTCEDVRGLVTNVQRFSIHDGPGIRTTVFLKGCPLRCFWCHNPETRRPGVELQFFGDRCIGCGQCVTACPNEAQLQVEGRRTFRRELCRACGRCVETCYAEALVMAGRSMAARELLDVLLRDREFYAHSGGGVTLSGGEPMLQHAFTQCLLRLCHEAGLHTTIETAAFCRWEELAALLPYLDLVIMDIKLMDEAGHRAATGVSNAPILENARRLAATEMPLIVRTPVVPGVNDTPEAIGAVAEFIHEFPHLLYYELMPFHRLAQGKYHSLELPNPADDLQPPAREAVQAFAEHAGRTLSCPVKVG